MSPDLRPTGRRNGKTSRSEAAQELARVLAERFEWNEKSRIDPAARVAMAEVTAEDGTVAVRLLTYGEIAAAVLEAGWTPPRS